MRLLHNTCHTFLLGVLVFSGISVWGQKFEREDVAKPPRLEMDTIDSLPVPKPILIDSLPVDSVTKEETKDKVPVLDTDIYYNSNDSIEFDLSNQKVFLYKNATITYGDIELTADYIELDLKHKEVFAKGMMNDSTQQVEGTPVFTGEGQEFKAKLIRYAFESKKAIIFDIITEQEGGFIHGERTKQVNDSTFCILHGKYTTCDHEHPHFYLKLSKAKVLKDKAIVTGPAYMVLEDFPIYFPILPFGYFPNTKTYSSGILFPGYGEENQRGFYLRDGGYYWAASEYFDASIRTEIFSKGSWGVKLNSNYKKRYKFGGSFDFQYFKNKFEPTTAEEIINGSKISKDLKITWSHRQDSKANPNSNFSASVNYSNSSFDKNNSYTADRYLTNSKSSSISYRKKFENTPFSMSMNLRHSQNSRDSTISLSLPEMTITMNKIYPFKRKKRVGKTKWYEKFGFSYSGNIRNSINKVKEDELFTSDQWKNGANHKFSITLPGFRMLKHVNLSPSISYDERWYTSYTTKEWKEQQIVYNPISEQNDTVLGGFVDEKHSGFRRNYEYSYGVSASTQVYGFYTFGEKSKVKAIRHVMKPSVSFSYRPDFDGEKYGFRAVTNGYTEEELTYNQYEGQIFGYTRAGRSGSIGFSLKNNLEMKVLNTNDTTSNEQFKKVTLLDDLSFSGSYNLVADSFNLSNISIRGRTKVKGVNVNFGGTIDPYAVNEEGRRINTFEWKKISGWEG